MSMQLEMKIMSVEDEIYLLTTHGIRMYEKIEEECRLVHLCELNRLKNLINAKKADLFLLEAIRDSNQKINYPNFNNTEKSKDTDTMPQTIDNGPRSMLVGKYFVRVLPKRAINDVIDITYHIQAEAAQVTLFQKIKRIVTSFLKNWLTN